MLIQFLAVTSGTIVNMNWVKHCSRYGTEENRMRVVRRSPETLTARVQTIRYGELVGIPDTLLSEPWADRNGSWQSGNVTRV